MIEVDDDDFEDVEELLIDRFGKRSHVELRLNSHVFIPVSLVSQRLVLTTNTACSDRHRAGFRKRGTLVQQQSRLL